ncbi:hypothetical protein [Pseudomonas trivialis]|uniref:Type III secretion effector protein n=1 Tax=Pseudomonas trivialis TaxID=200450 RepID=A0A0H5AMP4_9PSED|nr:hypothetical protein [Pseudomonas trivialis]AKS05372.1 hypothetical protein AA957_04340 [Pseudomonas trivialis]
MVDSVNALRFTQPAVSARNDFPLPHGGGVNNYRFPNGSERHFDGQNLYGDMTKVGNPFTSSDDHLLASDLKNDLPLLDAFRKDGKLTLASFNDAIASSDVSERTRKLLEAILNRPRVKEAITGKGREITADSLSDAAKTLHGNTDPNTYSANPFHSKSNRQVAEAFLAVFGDWRDKSKDIDIFGEKHWYVHKDKIAEIASDPDFTDNGKVVLDSSTGTPRKKYRTFDVHLANTLMDRPELRTSLDDYKANGYNPLGSRNHDDWYKNYSIKRWTDTDKEEKGE